MIDSLDGWVEKAEQPPPTKSDALELCDANGDGINENPAISMPEVACPIGVYYGRTPQAQETAFAAFDGVNLEPIDGDGKLVDMNGNGRRDKRETVARHGGQARTLEAGREIHAEKVCWLHC